MSTAYSILCIDDEENILQSLNRLLRMEGYTIFLANSGAQGLEILRKEKIDLILCDQKMPHLCGFEVLRIAKEECPDAIRIMLSGYSDFDSLVKTINEGEIFRYQSKPWNADDLKETIRLSLERKTRLCEIHEAVSEIKKLNTLIKDIKLSYHSDQSGITIYLTVYDTNQTKEEIISTIINYISKLLGINTIESVGMNNNAESNQDIAKLQIHCKEGIQIIIDVRCEKTE